MLQDIFYWSSRLLMLQPVSSLSCDNIPGPVCLTVLRGVTEILRQGLSPGRDAAFVVILSSHLLLH